MLNPTRDRGTIPGRGHSPVVSPRGGQTAAGRGRSGRGHRALITASFQVGAALGLAILSALATARTNQLLAGHATASDALAVGYGRAVLGAAGRVLP
jgi:hypothetical protein